MTRITKHIRIYADESVNIAIVEGLRRRGVDAFAAKDLGKLGLTDGEQLETAIRERAVILTNDADFIRMAQQKAQWYSLRSPAQNDGRRMHQETQNRCRNQNNRVNE